MTFTLPLFSLASPEIAIFSMSGIILLIDVFIPKRFNVITYMLVQLTLTVAFCLTLSQYYDYTHPVITFSGHYVLDKLSILLKLFIFPMSFFSFIYAGQYLEERNIGRSEFYILGLFCVLGMSVMASAYSFLSLYLGLELMSLPLYALVACNKKSQQSTEAAMKYFITGALASGMLLYGISIIYGLTGSVQISTLAQLLQTSPQVTILLALIFVIAALIFKFGAVPFHMWVPDVYQGAPTPVTLFIATAPKVAAFGITLRILMEVFPAFHLVWTQILIVIALLSMFFGNILAIAQTNIKRMLAYSSIAHVGYTLLGVLAGPYTSTGYSAAIFYIATYGLVSAGAFGIVTMLSHRGLDFEQLEDYRGLNARNPFG